MFAVCNRSTVTVLLLETDLSGDFLFQAEGLGAIRGERVLFTSVSLDLKAGDAIVLRGANGTGKSTLLRMLAGLSRPDSGQIERRAKHHWLGHRDGVKPHETPRQHLRHWARAWGSEADVTEVAVVMGLERPMDVAGRLLSAGQRRRTAIGRLRLVQRPVWLLDEPFNALDADGRKMLAGMIEAHRAAGGGVVSALHGDAPFEASGEVVL